MKRTNYVFLFAVLLLFCYAKSKNLDEKEILKAILDSIGVVEHKELISALNKENFGVFILSKYQKDDVNILQSAGCISMNYMPKEDAKGQFLISELNPDELWESFIVIKSAIDIKVAKKILEKKMDQLNIPFSHPTPEIRSVMEKDFSKKFNQIDTLDATVFISSIPPIATVFFNNIELGKTNVSKIKAISGTHIYKFILNGKEYLKELTLVPGENKSVFMTLK